MKAKHDGAKHDWGRADAMTDAQIHAAALGDPDAQPRTPERLAGLKPTSRLKIIRRPLGLTQEEFAARFQISVGMLRDWEPGMKQPDQAARAYLRGQCNLFSVNPFEMVHFG